MQRLEFDFPARVNVYCPKLPAAAKEVSSSIEYKIKINGNPNKIIENEKEVNHVQRIRSNK